MNSDHTKEYFMKGDKLDFQKIYDAIDPGNCSSVWDQKNSLIELNKRIGFGDYELEKIVNNIVDRTNRLLEGINGIETLVVGMKKEWYTAVGLNKI